MERRQVLPTVDAVADAREDFPSRDVRRAAGASGNLELAANQVRYHPVSSYLLLAAFDRQTLATLL